MPYDPQRSHRRPQLADDEPAPIDALLDGVDEAVPDEPAVVETVVVTETVDMATGEVVGVEVVDEIAIADEIEVVSARRTPRLAVLVAGLVVALLLLVWVRRRR